RQTTSRQGRRQIDRDRRLADPALAARHSQNPLHMGGPIGRHRRLGAPLIGRRLRQSGRAARRGGHGLGGQDDRHPLHARHGLQRRLGRIAHRGVKRRLLGGNLHDEARAPVGHHQSLHQPGGRQPLPRPGVGHGVEDGEDGGAVSHDEDSLKTRRTCRADDRRSIALSVRSRVDPLSQPLLTLIAGPTASGKSRLAMQRARETGAVIINADSQQLYADLRVLSARPSAEDEAEVPHRLYGVADAADAWSVGRWSRAVMDLLAELAAEGRPGLLVGGTGLYFNALTKGLAEIPPVPVDVRDAVQTEFDAEGEAVFRRRLAHVDPAAEAAIFPADRQRLVRAFSVHRASGRALSDWKADTRSLLAPGSYEPPVGEPPRERLSASWDARVDVMMAPGALDEVRALAARALPPDLPAMKAVGVRELAAHLAGDLSLDDAVAAVKQSTRNYAKRQLTWFRNQQRDWPRHPGFA